MTKISMLTKKSMKEIVMKMMSKNSISKMTTKIMKEKITVKNTNIKINSLGLFAEHY